MPTIPDAIHERAFRARGLIRVAGVDEAGRGAWAGPVVVAAVILPPDRDDWPYRDSKTLSPGRREALAEHVRHHALAWAVEFAPPEEVDRFNVLEATRRAAVRAVARLAPPAEALVTDFLHLPLDLPFVAPPRADATSPNVAAASLLAKTARDDHMRELHEAFPQYGFAGHKGYGAAAHRAALERHGVSEVHRRSFAPIASLLAPLWSSEPEES